ncbi:MAG TPA: hypothetical protein VLG49_02485 [Rhabdochlamydiaceae bacterium]|nr:hypothetical protein [Rhabdochlamydiaceae bacterium]
MTTGSNPINREAIDSLMKNLPGDNLIKNTSNKRTFEECRGNNIVATAQAILDEKSPLYKHPKQNSSTNPISEKQVQPVREFSYLISCEYNFLSNSQKLELPRIILERINSTHEWLSDKEISRFFPENTVVQFTGNDEFKLIFKGDDARIFPHYQLTEYPILQKNLSIIANILEQIIYVSEIKNEKLDELIDSMKNANSLPRLFEFLTDLKRIQANFETKPEPWFLDLCPQLKLSEKLELPIAVLKQVQSTLRGLTKEKLLELIPENTLAEKKDKLVLQYKSRFEKIPENYCAPEGIHDNGNYWKKSNVYFVGMVLKTILNKEIDPKLKKLITSMTKSLSHERPTESEALEQLELIQKTFRSLGN